MRQTHSYCGSLIGSYKYRIELPRFRWPWMTLKDVKDTFFSGVCPYVCWYRLTHSDQISSGDQSRRGETSCMIYDAPTPRDMLLLATMIACKLHRYITITSANESMRELWPTHIGRNITQSMTQFDEKGHSVLTEPKPGFSTAASWKIIRHVPENMFAI